MTLSERASKHLVEAQVTGFTSPTASAVIYLGSFLWFSLLVTADIIYITGEQWNDTVKIVYSTTLGLNVFMFLLQTWNVVWLHFRFWPVVALYYTCQLGVLGLSSSVVGYSLSFASNSSKVWMSMLRLLAQCLFTASQLSVTLETLHRAAYQEAIVGSMLTPVASALASSSPRGIIVDRELAIARR